MKAVYIATGIKDSLEQILLDKPKALLRINGKNLIEHQIEEYLKSGVLPKDITIVPMRDKELIENCVKTLFRDIEVSPDIKLTDELTIVSSDKFIFSSESIKKLAKSNITCTGRDCDIFLISQNDLGKFEHTDARTIFDKSVKNFYDEFPESDVNCIKIENLKDLYKAEKQLSKFSLEGKKALIFDLDGTVYLGNKPIQNTIDFIKNNYKKYKFYFMTNNTSRNLSEYVVKLNNFGIPVTIERIISPLIPLMEYLEHKKISKIFPLANTSMKSYLKDKKPDIVFTDSKQECQAVVMGFDTELTYDKLKSAAYLLADKKIAYLATHGDNVCPTEKGDIPDVGSFIALFEKTVNRLPDMFFGKPAKILLKPILDKYSKNELAVFGDRVYTDKLLANNSGIDFVLVLTGETKRRDVEKLDKFPELIINDCGELS